MAYAPFQSSGLASSPSTSLRPPAAPSSSDLPSSPTTASFYNASPSNVASSLSRNTSRPRLHKSQTSNRTSSARNLNLAASSSSPSASPSNSTVKNPFRSIHEHARLQRSKQARAHRDLSSKTGPFVPDEPGGWTRDGEWEEFDEYERETLELEMLKERKEWKWQMRVKDEQASDALLDPEDEFDDDDMQEEPPPDILSDYEPPLPSPSATRLPSLASSISSSPFLGDSSLAPSPSPQDFEDAAMSNPQNEGFEFERSASTTAAFEKALLSATCPVCSGRDQIKGDETGAKCMKCNWAIEMDVLGPLALAFARHGDAERGHLPLFSHTLFTGTLVFCRACEEQFAA